MGFEDRGRGIFGSIAENIGVDRKDIFGIATCAFMLAMFLLYLFLTRPPAETPSTNRLAVGTHAKVRGTVEVPMFRPQPLSNLSRGQIFKLRRDSVRQSGDFLLNDYEPSGSVFAKMENNIPWFSIMGFSVWGRSQKSLIGPSTEARYLLNPYLLVSPEFWGVSRWGTGAVGGIKWDWKKITRADLDNPDFPFYCRANNLKWQAEELKAESHYLLSDYLNKLDRYIVTPVKRDRVLFGLTAYNARDFGFNYLAIDKAASSNIQETDEAEKPLQITDRIVPLPNFCSFDTTCNHSDIPILEADKIVVGPLPAKVVVKLWNSAPADASAAPNFLYTILLE